MCKYLVGVVYLSDVVYGVPLADFVDTRGEIYHKFEVPNRHGQVQDQRLMRELSSRDHNCVALPRALGLDGAYLCKAGPTNATRLQR